MIAVAALGWLACASLAVAATAHLDDERGTLWMATAAAFFGAASATVV